MYCKYSYDTSTAEHLSLYPWRLSVSLYSMCICSVMVLRTTLQVLPLPKYNFSLWMQIIVKVLSHWADPSIELQVIWVALPIQVLSLPVSFSTEIYFYDNSRDGLFRFWLWFRNLDIHSPCLFTAFFGNHWMSRRSGVPVYCGFTIIHL